MLFVSIALSVAYFMSGFVIRAGWRKMSDDERLLWTVAYPIHALLLNSHRVRIRWEVLAVVLNVAAYAGLVYWIHQIEQRSLDESFKTAGWAIGLFWFGLFGIAAFFEEWQKFMDYLSGTKR